MAGRFGSSAGDKGAGDSPVAARRHPVHVYAAQAHEQLDELVGADGSGYVAVSELGAEATRESIVEISRLQDRLTALQATLLDHGAAIGLSTPDSPVASTEGWYAHAVVRPAARATREVKLARCLQSTFAATGRALAAGGIDAEQAQEIVSAVDALPSFVGDRLRREAEAHLLERAQEFDARALRRLGRHLLEVVDPEGLDQHLATKLAEEEARVARTTYLAMRDDGRGTVHGRFALPALSAAMLQTALDAIANPKRPEPLPRERQHPDGARRAIPTSEVLGQAFCELIERYPADRLPGGINATVVVTMDLETLTGGTKAAHLDTGVRISAHEARRVAGQSRVIPAVLGTDGQILDLGRAARLHTTGQRIALRATHRACSVDGCTVPSAWCHAHHKRPWALGGETSLRNGTLLCPAHHRLAHRPGFEATYDGNVTRIVRTTVRRQ